MDHPHQVQVSVIYKKNFGKYVSSGTIEKRCLYRKLKRNTLGLPGVPYQSFSPKAKMLCVHQCPESTI